MLDTALAHRRHFPAINWFHSFSLYEAGIVRYFENNTSGDWGTARRKCLSLLQKEEKLREVATIVGAEGLQDNDHLLLQTAERIHQDFLIQNSFSEDAFSTPELTIEKIRNILAWYDDAATQLEEGTALNDILNKRKT